MRCRAWRFEQARRRVQQERQERAVGLGEIKRALEGVPGGGRVAERVLGDRLQHERLNQPGPPDLGSGAVQDRREGGGRRVRVVLGEPQRRGGDTHLAVFAVLVAEAGEDLLGAFGLAEAHQGVQHKGPRRRDEQGRRGQAPGQPFGGTEGGQRVGVPATRQLELAAAMVDQQRHRRLGFRSEVALGALGPGLCFLGPALPGQHAPE